MNKFKMGDRVIVKSSDGYTTSTSVYEIGDIGTITDISDKPAYKTARYKLDDEYGGWVNEEDLELLKDTSTLYTPSGLEKLLNKTEKRLEAKFISHIEILVDALNKKGRKIAELENNLKYKNNTIRELTERIIKITNEEED